MATRKAGEKPWQVETFQGKNNRACKPKASGTEFQGDSPKLPLPVVFLVW